MSHKLFDHIDGLGDWAVDLHAKLCAIPALGPKNGGPGEKDKADFLKTFLLGMGLTDIREYNAPDPEVPCGYRPNLAAILPGKNTAKTLWVISHTDIVPPGDLSLWKTDPYTLVRHGDTLIGRGVEDNHQGVVTSLLAAKAFLDVQATPDINLGLLFVADEETGSGMGLDYMVEHHADLFRKGDLFLVPDFGDRTSEMIEVAEKHLLWVKITLEGKQCHASTPDEGINTLTASAAYILEIPELYYDFPDENPLFAPPYSTFEATKKEANVENVNTIPGRDVFYVDCRILPQYPVDDVLARLREIGETVADEYGVTASLDIVQRQDAAPQTPADAEIVTALTRSIKTVYPKANPRPTGIGGGTVAAFLRRKGHPAVVWSTLIHNAHQPNEAGSLAFNLGDAKVIAHMLGGEK